MLNSILGLIRKRLLSHITVGVLFVGCVLPQTARSALIITADLTDLADVVPGDDLWHANFTLSNASLLSGQGFTIYFDPLLYEDLSAPLAPLSPDWDVLTAQPDPGLSAPGFLDGLALVHNPSLGLPFSLDFTWLGPSQPGSQPFEVYDTDGGGFQIIGGGDTVVSPGGPTAVPDAGSLFWPFGLVCLAMLVQRKTVREPECC